MGIESGVFIFLVLCLYPLNTIPIDVQSLGAVLEPPANISIGKENPMKTQGTTISLDDFVPTSPYCLW